MVLAEVFGLLCTLVIVFVEWEHTQPAVVSLVAMLLFSSMVYSVHFPTRFAFTQELFEPHQYQRLNSLLEIQGQIAFMVAGALGGVLVEVTTFANVMLIDAITFGLGALFFAAIPYQPVLKTLAEVKPVWQNVKEGISFIKTYRHTTSFFVYTMLPFIAVLIGMYLVPIYVAKTLKADALVYGWHEVIWSVGAIIAGLTIPILTTRVQGRVLVIWSVLLYSMCVLALVLNTSVGGFLIISLLMGWGNAGRRVARATVMMESIDNRMIGRMNSTLMSFGKLLQVFLVYGFTLVIPVWGTKGAFAVLGVLLLFTCWGAWQSNKCFVSSISTKVAAGD
ncbi:MFS transporter [Microscilla marina]|nr:MFS transporter [Microscilla marina]